MPHNTGYPPAPSLFEAVRNAYPEMPCLTGIRPDLYAIAASGGCTGRDWPIVKTKAPQSPTADRPLARRTARGRRKRLGWQYAELHHRLRTADDPPWRQAWSIAVGTFLGCTPFYGLHIPACIFVCRLLRLSIVKATLATQITNPVFAPFIIFLEFYTGRLLLTGGLPALSLREVSNLGFRELGLSLLLGSLVVGVVLGGFLGLVALWVGLHREEPSFRKKLMDIVSRRYINTGIFNWEFVRAKLNYDSVYQLILRRGLLPAQGTIIDLGCGRGILFALLAAARELAEDPARPADWPAHGGPWVLRGVEANSALARTARRALRGVATIERGNVTSKPVPPCHGVLLLDVLHHLPYPEQESLLARVSTALEPGGVVLIRETDAGAGWRFRLTSAADRIAGIRRWRLARRHRYRTLEDWTDLLESLGYRTRVVPVAETRWYADLLIEARRDG